VVKSTNSILFQDISQLIESAKNHVARYTNSTLVSLYWHIGARINQDILKNKRAGYGNRIIKKLSEQLTANYGRGFNVSSLFKMIRFFKKFPDAQIVSTLSTQFSWSHFEHLTGIEDSLKRQFYTEICRIERWSVRELRKKIDGMLYERTAISQKPEKVIQQDLAILRDKNEVSQDLVFRDPYKHERKKGENKPLGLILCAEKKQEHIELLELNRSGIHVAQYLTQLPSKETLGNHLRKAIEIAQGKQDIEKCKGG
jgi:hypothetical protein